MCHLTLQNKFKLRDAPNITDYAAYAARDPELAKDWRGRGDRSAVIDCVSVSICRE